MSDDLHTFYFRFVDCPSRFSSRAIGPWLPLRVASVDEAKRTVAAISHYAECRAQLDLDGTLEG